MFKRLFFTFLFFGSAPLLSAQSDTSGVYRELMNAISALKADPSVKAGNWGFCFGHADSGKVICRHNADKLFIPASTMKLVSTATALSMKGPEFRYITTFGYTGSIQDSVLKGNLILSGSGDPTLGSLYSGRNDSLVFSRWKEAVKRAGIREVQGSVMADIRSYEGKAQYPDWNEGDLGNYYGAGLWALNMKDNSYDIWFRPSKRVGNPAAIISITPDIPCLNIQNYVRTGKVGSGDQVNIYMSDNDCDRTCRGTVPAGVDSFAVSGSVPNVPLYCATRLTEQLKNTGVRITEKPGVISSVKAKIPELTGVLDTIASPPLSQIIQHTNYYSVNVFAEGLFRSCGYWKLGKGSSASGSRAVRDYWQAKGLHLEDTCITDGCGLSPNNRLSPAQFFSLLSLMKKDAGFDAFFQSLPVSGQSGTLRHVCKGTTAEGRIHAKSGYLKTARAYAGYITGKKGNLYSFVIILNNYKCSAGAARQKMEKLMIRMADFD